MAEPFIAGAIGSLNAGKLIDQIAEKHGNLRSKYSDLQNQAASAVKLADRSMVRTGILCVIAMAVAVVLYPDVNTGLVALVLALCVFLPLVSDVRSALSTLRDIEGLAGDGVIMKMKDEFLHQIQIFRDSDAGQWKEPFKVYLEIVENIPDFTSVTRGRYLPIWLSIVVSVVLFMLVVFTLFAAAH